jgi:predicted nuclease of predicted toxin-antitoxin system
VKLWFDEDLSPTLVQVANELGFEATCNRDRTMLGRSDHALRRVVQAEGYVFVTDNASDFRPMYARDDVHPGLIVMPATVGRIRQQQLAKTVIEWISNAAPAERHRPDEFMLGMLVAIDEGGGCSAEALPPSV